MVPFRYVEFYDVPRTVLSYNGKHLLLQSAFSDTLDEYPDVYSVYELPESTEASLAAGSWSFLEYVTLKSIGEIPVRAVKFDSTKRKALDPSILDDLLDRCVRDSWRNYRDDVLTKPTFFRPRLGTIRHNSLYPAPRFGPAPINLITRLQHGSNAQN